MVSRKPNLFIPDMGDIVWLDFEPQSGREIMKRRPALILTPRPYNRASGLCFACPISSQIKGYMTEVPVEVEKTPSVILTHQMKSLDWKTRRAALISKAPEKVVLQARKILMSLLFEDVAT